MDARFAVWGLALALVACSDDVATGFGAGTADALGAADLAVAEVADEPVAPDVAASAVGLPAWITGTWLECGGTLTIAAPASATWKPAGKPCVFTATLLYKDGALDFTAIDPGQCQGQPPSWFTTGTHVSFDGQQLAIVDAQLFTGIKRFSHNPTRESWAFTAGGGGTGTMNLCFDASGQFYDGVWTSSACDLIACGSIVTQVKVVDTETHIWTECQGSCPCTAIVIAKSKTASAMGGTFASGDCQKGASGTFTAVPAPFPD